VYWKKVAAWADTVHAPQPAVVRRVYEERV
jgi:hypothetical protein